MNVTELTQSAPIEKTVKTKKSYQDLAIEKLHLPPDQAAQIKEWSQYEAITTLHLSFDQAVKITELSRYNCVEAKLKSPWIKIVNFVCDNTNYWCDKLYDLEDVAIQGCINNLADEPNYY